MQISVEHDRSPEQGVIEDISREISRQVSEWCGVHASLESPFPMKLIYPNSFLLRYQLLGHDCPAKTLIVKIPHEQGMQFIDQAISKPELREVAKGEFDMLVSVYDVVSKLKIEQFKAIRPLAFYPQWNAVVMEELSAKTLEKLAFNLRTRLQLQPEWGQFTNAISLASRWVRMYHETFGEWRVEPLDTDRLIVELHRKIQFLRPYVGHKVDLESLQDQFECAIMNIRGLSVPHVYLHGDFYFTNIMVTPEGRVAVIDLERRYWGPIYNDLSSLVTELVDQRLKLSSLGFLTRDSVLRELEQAIRVGYSNTGVEDEVVLPLFCAKEMLAIWHWYEQRIVSVSGLRKLIIRLAQPFFRKYIQEEIEYFLGRVH